MHSQLSGIYPHECFSVMSSQRGERGVARLREAARAVTDSTESQYMIQQLARSGLQTQRPEREIRNLGDGPRTAQETKPLTERQQWAYYVYNGPNESMRVLAAGSILTLSPQLNLSPDYHMRCSERSQSHVHDNGS